MVIYHGSMATINGNPPSKRLRQTRLPFAASATAGTFYRFIHGYIEISVYCCTRYLTYLFIYILLIKTFN